VTRPHPTWLALLTTAGLAALVAVAVPAVAPLPSTLDTAGILDVRTANWEDPGTGATNVGVTGDTVTVFITEGVNQVPDIRDCVDDEQHKPFSYEGEVRGPTVPVQDNNGHGAAVAGVLCGDGTMSDRLGYDEPVTGVAPDARIWAYGKVCVNGCPQWLDGDTVKVYTDSTDSNTTFDAQRHGAGPNEDLLIVQSAGNHGGDGSTADTTFPYHDPRVMGIAGATHDGSNVIDESSRGDEEDPSTWPSLTAPDCQWTQAVNPFVHAFSWGVHQAAGTMANPENCPPATVEQVAMHRAGGYILLAGTSFAAPYVSGTAALMYEVHPGLPALDAKHLLTRTADPFLEVPGVEDPSPKQFWQAHGYKAGYGHVNATGALAAAHYMALNPQATPQQAVDCFTVDRTSVGTLVLNPTSGCGG
jgi:subtilisin family serine protease